MKQQLRSLRLLAAAMILLAPIGSGFVAAEEPLPFDAETTELQRIRQAIAHEGQCWTAAPSEVSSLPLTLRRRLPGARTPLFDPAAVSPSARAALLPPAIDWRNHQGTNWLTPVKDQRTCGSCWVFAVVGLAETIFRIEHQRPDVVPDLSEQQLLSCSNGGDCDGGYAWDAATYLRQSGVAPESCQPYTAQDDPCDPCEDWQDRTFRASTVNWVCQGGEDRAAIRSALQQGPLAAWMEVYSDLYYYRDGVYAPTAAGQYEGGHFVVLCGYDDAENCWIVKNSWGASWGDRGYFRIRMGTSGFAEWVLRLTGMKATKRGVEGV